MILAARVFGPDAGGEWRNVFMRYWLLNGGQFADLGGLFGQACRVAQVSWRRWGRIGENAAHACGFNLLS